MKADEKDFSVSLDEQTEQTEQNVLPWNRLIRTLEALSELSNTGIVIQVIGKWVPSLLTIGGGFFVTLAYIADPTIYFFKSLIRLVRLAARWKKIPVDDEKYGTHPLQTFGDLLCVFLYVAAIILFILKKDIATTLGWVIAITGLMIVGFFDYIHQENCVKELMENVQGKSDTTLSRSRDLHNAHTKKRNATRLYFLMIFGLWFLLVCGSAVPFAPFAIKPVLFMASKMASLLLTCIAVGRFANFICGDKITFYARSCANFIFRGKADCLDLSTDSGRAPCTVDSDLTEPVKC